MAWKVSAAPAAPVLRARDVLQERLGPLPLDERHGARDARAPAGHFAPRNRREVRREVRGRRGLDGLDDVEDHRPSIASTTPRSTAAAISSSPPPTPTPPNRSHRTP